MSFLPARPGSDTSCSVPVSGPDDMSRPASAAIESTPALSAKKKKKPKKKGVSPTPEADLESAPPVTPVREDGSTSMFQTPEAPPRLKQSVGEVLF